MKLKQYLPYEAYILYTDLPVQEVLDRIKENVRPLSRKILSGQQPDKPYEGTVTEPMFEISRVISYRNSFLPKISGRVFSRGPQTHVIVKMRLFSFVAVFMTIWLSFAALLFIFMASLSIFYTQKFLQSPGILFLLMPLGMFIFGSLLSIIPFKAEAEKSKKFLQKLLESKE